MDGVYSNIFYCSFETHVAGIKFYSGFESLRPLTRVKLQREPENPIDLNLMVVIIAKNGERIGHLDKKAAAALTRLIDAKMPGLKICG